MLHLMPLNLFMGTIAESTITQSINRQSRNLKSQAPKFIYGVNLKSPICNLQLLDNVYIGLAEKVRV